MIGHLRSCLPLEGVGLLSVRGGDRRPIAAAYYPGRNIDASETRYTMDPDDVRAALRDIARRGTWLGGIVHSHPRTPPTPSRGDIRELSIPGVLMVIVGFMPAVDIRAWQLVPGRAGEPIDVREATVGISRAWPIEKRRPGAGGAWHGRGAGRTFHEVKKG